MAQWFVIEQTERLGTSFAAVHESVDNILHGPKPADIPLEQPTKFDFVVNLKIAKAHGLAISEAFLLRADEVIK
jgi:ABC-type uncharacterized transport system substrate-binding protein